VHQVGILEAQIHVEGSKLPNYQSDSHDKQLPHSYLTVSRVLVILKEQETLRFSQHLFRKKENQRNLFDHIDVMLGETNEDFCMFWRECRFSSASRCF
jgi:hypothetical protein